MIQCQIHYFPLLSSDMAAQEEILPLSESEEDVALFDSVTDPSLDWVAVEPQGNASHYIDSLVMAFRIVKDRVPDSLRNWVVSFLIKTERICSRFSDDRCAMYEYVFNDVGLCLPILASRLLCLRTLGWHLPNFIRTPSLSCGRLILCAVISVSGN